MDDVRNNPEAIIEAVANALGIPPEEVSIDMLYEAENGIVADVRTPEDTEIPKDFGEKVTAVLAKTPEFAEVEVFEPGSFLFLGWLHTKESPR